MTRSDSFGLQCLGASPSSLLLEPWDCESPSSTRVYQKDNSSGEQDLEVTEDRQFFSPLYLLIVFTGKSVIHVTLRKEECKQAMFRAIEGVFEFP